MHTEQCENCAIASLLAASEYRNLRCFDALDHFAAMEKHFVACVALTLISDKLP